MPMRRTRERRRQLRRIIALRRVQLGLNQKDTPGEVGSPQVGISEISPDNVSHPQISAAQISRDEVRFSQVRASQVGAVQVGPDEIGSGEVLLLLNFRARQFACAQQQDIDISPVRRYIKLHEFIGAALRQALCLLQRVMKRVMQDIRRAQR